MNESVIIQKLIQVGQMLERGELEYNSAEAGIKHYLEQYAALREHGLFGNEHRRQYEAQQETAQGFNLTDEDRLKRSDKLWKKLIKELSVLQDDNFTARQLFDYVERHYCQPPQQPPIGYKYDKT